MLRPPGAGARPGGELRVGILAPKAVAPWLTTTHDPYGTLVVRTMCDALLATDPRSGKVVGGVAERYRLQGPEDFLLRLRKNQVFNDGTKLVAQDVVTSLSRVADSDVASPVADLLADVQGFDTLHGLKRIDVRGDRANLLDGVLSPEPASVEVLLSKSNTSFLATLTHPLATPVPTKAYRRDPAGLARQPVCVGPYRLAQPWSPKDKEITLVRSVAYRGSSAYSGQGRGYADRVLFHVYPNRAAMVRAYQAGMVDIAFVPPESVKQASRLDGYVTAPTGVINLIGLPTSRPPFDDERVRQALSLGLDRTAFAVGAGGLQQPATRVLTSNLGPAYAKDARCDLTVPAHADVTAATRILSDARLPLRGKAVSLFYDDEFANKSQVEAVAAQWREKFGLNVTLRAEQWEDFIQQGRSASGFDGAFRYSWVPEVPTADGYLYPLFSSNSAQQDNLTRFATQSFDKLIEKAREEINDVVQRQEYLEAEKKICNALPMLPLTYGRRGLLFNHTRLGEADGIWTDVTYGLPALRGLFLRG